MADAVATYKGKRADELTRDELIEAYSQVVRELQRERDSALQNVEMERLFTDVRRHLSRRA